MNRLASSLPEYNVVMSMFGVGSVLGSQLIAEIGDVSRFHNKRALVAFAGLDAPPFQSGNFNAQSRSISKRGSASLRKTLFQVMSVILKPLWTTQYFNLWTRNALKASISTSI